MLSAPGWTVHHASKYEAVYELTIQDSSLHLAMDSLLWQENLRTTPILLGSHRGFDTDRRRADLTVAARVTASDDASDDAPLAGLPVEPGPITPVVWGSMPRPLRDALRPRVERLGYLGAFFGFAGHQPQALLGFVTSTEELKAALPDDVSDVMVLAVATALDNTYERIQHERLAGRHGRSPEWVEAAKSGAGQERELTATQAGTRALAVAAATTGGHGAREELRELTGLLGEQQAMAVLRLVSRYVAHAHARRQRLGSDQSRTLIPSAGSEPPVVRQIVLIRWTEDATEEGKRAVGEALLGLREIIEQVRDVRLGVDLGVRADNFDFAVSVDFDSAEDYLVYREHPAHVKVVTEVIRPVMGERAGCVFEAV